MIPVLLADSTRTVPLLADGVEEGAPLPCPGSIRCLPRSNLVLQPCWAAPGGPQPHQLSPASLPLLALPSAWNAPQPCHASEGEWGGGLVSPLPRGSVYI